MLLLLSLSLSLSLLLFSFSLLSWLKHYMISWFNNACYKEAPTFFAFSTISRYTYGTIGWNLYSWKTITYSFPNSMTACVTWSYGINSHCIDPLVYPVLQTKRLSHSILFSKFTNLKCLGIHSMIVQSIKVYFSYRKWCIIDEAINAKRQHVMFLMVPSIIVTWALKRFKLPTTLWCVQQVVQLTKKKTSRLRITGPFWGNHRLREMLFHVIM